MQKEAKIEEILVASTQTQGEAAKKQCILSSVIKYCEKHQFLEKESHLRMNL